MSDPLWLVTFAYFSERADVYVVAAQDEQAARERAAEAAAVGELSDGKWVRKAVLEDSRVRLVRDGLHAYEYASY